MINLGGDTFKQRHLEAQLIKEQGKRFPYRTWRSFVLDHRDNGMSAPALSRIIYRDFGIQIDQKTVLRWLKQAQQEREQAQRKPPAKGDSVRLRTQ